MRKLAENSHDSPSTLLSHTKLFGRNEGVKYIHGLVHQVNAGAESTQIRQVNTSSSREPTNNLSPTTPVSPYMLDASLQGPFAGTQKFYLSVRPASTALSHVEALQGPYGVKRNSGTIIDPRGYRLE